ncbi:hypothetical protein FNU76_22280 [Chitinimonas arctica]|uniref:Uncharacterized protein n=1 Tax=Chitinimonas arctica TaxID=2594795 RepID=A0A516SL30_9NEIS|nr:DUF6402 family protein [Chitinimonas arctica]QDQ28856.1 hypothetical protein FNU76_22280 [Chitinimonas arctica]
MATARLSKELDPRRAILPPAKRVFRLDDIPGVMEDCLSWPVAASLLRRWFSQPAWTMSADLKTGRGMPTQLDAAQVDEDTVRMDWLLRYERVQQACSALLAAWHTPVGLKRLREQIRAQGPQHAKGTWLFGDLSLSARQLDATCQVNARAFGGMSDPFDECYGAIGRGMLRLAVSGVVQAQGNLLKITVFEVGVYLRDSYDFSEDGCDWLSQTLGCWGHDGLEKRDAHRRRIEIDAQCAGEEAEDLKYEVHNEDFRRYRLKHALGGDFLVFSDVHRVRLSHPQTFVL